jgi:hypothetical protein
LISWNRRNWLLRWACLTTELHDAPLVQIAAEQRMYEASWNAMTDIKVSPL